MTRVAAGSSSWRHPRGPRQSRPLAIHDRLRGPARPRSAPNCKPSTRPWRPRTGRHRQGMAEQERPGDRARAGQEGTHPPRPRRAARRQDSRAPAQRPSRYRDAAGTRRADEQAGTLDRLGHRRVPRPRPAAAAAPLRRLARDPPAARPARRFACHPQPGRGSPAAHQGRCRVYAVPYSCAPECSARGHRVNGGPPGSRTRSALHTIGHVDH